MAGTGELRAFVLRWTAAFWAWGRGGGGAKTRFGWFWCGFLGLRGNVFQEESPLGLGTSIPAIVPLKGTLCANSSPFVEQLCTSRPTTHEVRAEMAAARMSLTLSSLQVSKIIQSTSTRTPCPE